MATSRKLTVVDGGNTPHAAWRRGVRRVAPALIRGRDKHPTACPHNLMLILEHDAVLAGLFWLDEFGNRIVLDRTPPWAGGKRDEFTEVDALELAAWLGDPAHYTMTVGVNLVLQSVEAIARRRKRHTVREYLENLQWDGTPRVARMFVDLFGAEDSAYASASRPACWSRRCRASSGWMTSSRAKAARSTSCWCWKVGRAGARPPRCSSCSAPSGTRRRLSRQRTRTSTRRCEGAGASRSARWTASPRPTWPR
jgi:hypothetical protein